jgi:uncharacterized repeat protein (TIGR03803 family)
MIEVGPVQSSEISTTVNWGTRISGSVFKLSPNSDGTWTETVLYVFTGGADGSAPNGDLVFDGAGNLYGTTNAGGADRVGTVFKLSPNSDGTWTETVLHSFTGGADGGDPRAGVILDAAGNLYGTTLEGGFKDQFCTAGCGVVFKLAPNSSGAWTETALYTPSYSPVSSTGTGPFGRLTFDAAGNLCGTMAGGFISYAHGLVFKLSPNSDGTWTYSVLYAFKGGRDGGNPYTGVIFDSAGNLYGTTVEGGTPCPPPGTTGYCGKVFKLTPGSSGSWTESAIHLFYAEADLDLVGIAFDAAGNLYGTTDDGGFHDNGQVFELTPQSGGGWAYSVPRFFYGEPSEYPRGGLIFDKAGNLYGETVDCGTGYNCYGTIFEITP